MAARTQHVVTAALIVARTGSTERYFDRGAVLPEDVKAEERKRLVGLGLVKAQKVEEQADPAAPATQPPADPPVDPNK
jgi:hypothetical protein